MAALLSPNYKSAMAGESPVFFSFGEGLSRFCEGYWK
jgi:hypothetical protein